MSTCALPTASTSNAGFSPAKAAAVRTLTPSLRAALATSAIEPRLDAATIALNVHIPPARPSGAEA